MNTVAIKNKIRSLEAELKLLKTAVYNKPIDFEADEKVWKMVKPILKKARAEIYKRTYA